MNSPALFPFSDVEDFIFTGYDLVKLEIFLARDEQALRLDIDTYICEVGQYDLVRIRHFKDQLWNFYSYFMANWRQFVRNEAILFSTDNPSEISVEDISCGDESFDTTFVTLYEETLKQLETELDWLMGLKYCGKHLPEPYEYVAFEETSFDGHPTVTIIGKTTLDLDEAIEHTSYSYNWYKTYHSEMIGEARVRTLAYRLLRFKDMAMEVADEYIRMESRRYNVHNVDFTIISKELTNFVRDTKLVVNVEIDDVYILRLLNLDANIGDVKFIHDVWGYAFVRAISETYYLTGDRQNLELWRDKAIKHFNLVDTHRRRKKDYLTRTNTEGNSVCQFDKGLRTLLRSLKPGI